LTPEPLSGLPGGQEVGHELPSASFGILNLINIDWISLFVKHLNLNQMSAADVSPTLTDHGQRAGRDQGEGNLMLPVAAAAATWARS
jgi:hypothetical protein